MQLSVVLVSLLAAVAQAAPSVIEKRSTTCGGNSYSTAQVNAAANAACNHVRAGSQAGSSTYPHRYNNYEGFNFDVSGPYNTFPMLTSGVYTGGELSPGGRPNCRASATEDGLYFVIKRLLADNLSVFRRARS